MPPELSSVTHNAHKKAIAMSIVVLVVMGAVVLAIFSPDGWHKAPSTNTPVATDPTRTEFGTKPPADFPTSIPLEQGADVTQSYSLGYTGKKQLTIVFSSTKTVKQNYDLYADFLKNDGWDGVNTYESATVSSMYAKKQGKEMNVTISAGAPSATSKSQVSISVLDIQIL